MYSINNYDCTRNIKACQYSKPEYIGIYITEKYN